MEVKRQEWKDHCQVDTPDYRKLAVEEQTLARSGGKRVGTEESSK